MICERDHFTLLSTNLMRTNLLEIDGRPYPLPSGSTLLYNKLHTWLCTVVRTSICYSSGSLDDLRKTNVECCHCDHMSYGVNRYLPGESPNREVCGLKFSRLRGFPLSWCKLLITRT